MIWTTFATARVEAAPIIQWTKLSSTPIAGLVLDNLKTWIHRPLEDSFWNAEAQSLIIVAQRAIERYAHLAIAPSTWVGTMPYIPAVMRLDRRPFLSVEKIEIVEPVAGEIIEVAASTYQAAPISQMCGQLRVDDDGWPEVAERQDAVRVTVKTGWPTAGDPPAPVIPEDILHAVMMMVASLDMHRGEEGSTNSQIANTVYGQTHSQGPMVIPPAVQAMLAPFRYVGLYAG